MSHPVIRNTVMTLASLALAAGSALAQTTPTPGSGTTDGSTNPPATTPGTTPGGTGGTTGQQPRGGADPAAPGSTGSTGTSPGTQGNTQGTGSGTSGMGTTPSANADNMTTQRAPRADRN